MDEVKIPGPPIGYVDMLDIAIQKKSVDEAAAPSRRNPMRPSSAGKCPREKAYEYAEFRGYKTYPDKEILTPESQRIFSLGHAAERDLMYHFKGVKTIEVRYAQQVLTFWPLSDGNLVEGSIDAVFLHPKWKTVIDFKSKKDKFSNYYATNWDETSTKLREMKSVKTLSDTTFWVEDLPAFLEELHDPFFEANFLQLNLYACHQFMKERGIDNAAIIQYNKNDSRLREVRFKPSQELFDRVRESDQAVVTSVEATKDPESVARGFALGSVKCAFCSFKTACWPGEDVTRAFYKSLPDKKWWPKDTNRLYDDGQLIEQIMEKYEKMRADDKIADQLAQEVIVLMEKNRVFKIKLDNGHVYETKKLKDSVSLRRSKL